MQENGRSTKAKPPTQDRDAGTSGEQDLNALKRTLQEQRRAFTLMRAEAEKERELREALEAQLLEANAEIVASWDRRKEMARVIAEQQAKLADGRKEAAALKRAQKKADELVAKLEQEISKRDNLVSNREQKITNLEQLVSKHEKLLSSREQKIANLEQLVSRRVEDIANLKQVVANRDQAIAKRDQAIAKRDKVLASREQVIANREQKISELKTQLRARYEELAALERHIVQSTISGKAKRLARQARQLTRKSFQG